MVRETNAECLKVCTKLLSSTFRPSLLKCGPIYYLTWFVTTPVSTLCLCNKQTRPLNEICELHNSIINIKKTVYFVIKVSFLKYIIFFTVIWHQQWPKYLISQLFFVIFSCNNAFASWTSWFAKVTGKFWELRELILVKLTLSLEVTIASLTWVWRSMAVFKSITDLINGCINGCVLDTSGTLFSCRDKKMKNRQEICMWYAFISWKVTLITIFSLQMLLNGHFLRVIDSILK